MKGCEPAARLLTWITATPFERFPLPYIVELPPTVSPIVILPVGGAALTVRCRGRKVDYLAERQDHRRRDQRGRTVWLITEEVLAA
jgi:hypothetical protein